LKTVVHEIFRCPDCIQMMDIMCSACRIMVTTAIPHVILIMPDYVEIASRAICALARQMLAIFVHRAAGRSIFNICSKLPLIS
jgi:hypothetical protein